MLKAIAASLVLTFALAARGQTTPNFGLPLPGDPIVAQDMSLLDAILAGNSPHTVVSAALPAGGENVASSATPTFSTAKLQSLMTLTGSVSSFTLPAGADGQLKVLIFCQNSTGFFTVAPPANVSGFLPTTVGSNPSTCSSTMLSYSTFLVKWLTIGAANQ